MSLKNRPLEKPTRITGNEKMRTFNERVRNGLEHALNFMLAAESTSKFTVTAFEPFLMPIESYINSYKKKSVLVKLYAEKAYEGELYWFFEIKSAIVLGGMMRMMTPSSLQERVTAAIFDETDQDAFGEVGNQLSGILDRAFRTLTNKNIHLKMDFKRRCIPTRASSSRPSSIRKSTWCSSAPSTCPASAPRSSRFSSRARFMR